VIHVRTRLTADFTVISNDLAQRRGSAVTIGVAAYIASVPDGSSVTITALCEHFDEGEILISRALRELEAAGYLERRRERTPTGQVRTRTYFYDVPGTDPDGPPPEPPKPHRPRKQPVRETAQAPVAAEANTPIPLAEADPRAVAVLAALRRVDPRLVLSEQEAARLAPAVTRWLAAGLLPTQIADHLTARLPDQLLTRPAGILAYRLKETPLHSQARPAEPPVHLPAVVPLWNCDGCDRAFRASTPGRCRDCRSGNRLRAAG